MDYDERLQQTGHNESCTACFLDLPHERPVETVHLAVTQPPEDRRESIRRAVAEWADDYNIVQISNHGEREVDALLIGYLVDRLVPRAV